ncbi:hypothetical protein [Rosistilla oblonga]|uniref:hypothetical protein n=1 Tax=Rosistilla oblonga TaxID=2527990 RepID=UPI003A969AF3
MLRSSITTCCLLLLLLISAPGCSLVPDAIHDPQVHNPFPQLKRIAVLPFFNQSNEPTLNQDAVAEAYYGELQAILGFEVLPVGVTKLKWHEFNRQYGDSAGPDYFQRFAQYLDVDAVVVGAVTDFTPYYPPRMAMTTHWYAANPGFHPIPPGYGLPWGTPEEKDIPRDVVLETEFELARAQLKTQSPQSPVAPAPQAPYPSSDTPPAPADMTIFDPTAGDPMIAGSLPGGWPDPTGLIPDPPSVVPPPMLAQAEPVLSHTRIYRGDDSEFTQKLADTFYSDDDARFGGWQSYLSRSDDFIRFCCKLHITEMLGSRGGKHKSDLILRWPISRYER